MKTSDKINEWLHPLMARRVCRVYRGKMKKVSEWHPELFKPINPETVLRHKKLWGKLGLGCTDRWVIWLSNISGAEDFRYCPEDVFYGRVERILNDCDRSGGGCEDKNQFFLYVPCELQAKTYLRLSRGAFYDEEFNWISDRAAQSILEKDHGDMIGKVCVRSLGGHGITKFSFDNGCYSGKGCNRLTTDWIRKTAVSYILQEKIDQCDFSAQFNPHSANSCKIVTLRCPWSGEIKVVKAGMRFGQTESVFDNLSSGGLSVCVDVTTGKLSRVAYDWFRCNPHLVHPMTNVEFADKVHPYWNDMRMAAIKYAGRVPDMNMLSWDMIVDKRGQVKILEVNATSQSSDWLQFAYGPLFAGETENVVEWCASHSEYDVFAHLRTFY